MCFTFINWQDIYHRLNSSSWSHVAYGFRWHKCHDILLLKLLISSRISLIPQTIPQFLSYQSQIPLLCSHHHASQKESAVISDIQVIQVIFTRCKISVNRFSANDGLFMQPGSKKVFRFHKRKRKKIQIRTTISPKQYWCVLIKKTSIHNYVPIILFSFVFSILIFMNSYYQCVFIFLNGHKKILVQHWMD